MLACQFALQAGSAAVSDLKSGATVYWCTCGLSGKQPFCDGSIRTLFDVALIWYHTGSHKGTGFMPVPWTVPTPAKEQYKFCLVRP